jgi:hypothetical protein
MRTSTAALAALLPLTVSTSVLSQGASPDRVQPRTTGAIVEGQPNTTGNDRDVVIAPGATGAETITTNPAAGGNASHPERAVPNGSAGSGSGQGGG